MNHLRSALARGRHDEQGMSLVELIVTFVVSALFLSLLATLFANGLVTQSQSLGRDVSTGDAQSAAAQLNRAIRSSNAVYLFPTFTNSNGLPQTQLNLTRVVRPGDRISGLRLNDFYCEVWIWEDLPNGQTILVKTLYKKYASSPLDVDRIVGSWKTAQSSGIHVRAAQSSTASGFVPRYVMLEYEVSGTVNDQSTPVFGGSFPQEITPIAGRANPCQTSGTWPPGT